MLTPQELMAARRKRPRTPASLLQRYQEYVMIRIEEFKDSIPRSELFALVGEAIHELSPGHDGQFLLTEVLAAEAVDALIMKRLGIKPFAKWKTWYTALRKAQQQPTHWQLPADSPVVPILPRLEAGDTVVACGPAAEAYAYLLAAHDAQVTFIAQETGLVERVEDRMMREALSPASRAYVVHPGLWFPEIDAPVDLVVLDASWLDHVAPGDRGAFIAELQAPTRGCGVHVLVPGAGELAPEALLCYYDGWSKAPPRRTRGRAVVREPVSGGVVLARGDDAVA